MDRPSPDVRRQPMAALQRNQRCQRQRQRRYIRRDGSPAVGLAPAGQWLCHRTANRCWPPRQGRSCVHRSVSCANAARSVRLMQTATWLPDGRVAFVAMEQGHDPRVYVQSLDGTPAPSRPGLLSGSRVSPDGQRVIFRLDHRLAIGARAVPQIVPTIPGGGCQSGGWTTTGARHVSKGTRPRSAVRACRPARTRSCARCRTEPGRPSAPSACACRRI